MVSAENFFHFQNWRQKTRVLKKKNVEILEGRGKVRFSHVRYSSLVQSCRRWYWYFVFIEFHATIFRLVLMLEQSADRKPTGPITYASETKM